MIRTPLYSEKQLVRSSSVFKWIIGALFLGAVLPPFLVFIDGDLREDGLLVLIAVLGTTATIMILFAISFVIGFLEIEIDKSGISFRYPPFIRKWKRLEFSEIKSWEVKEYDPFWSYGGWGIRWNLISGGKAYSVSGKWGLVIQKHDGKEIVFGTWQPEHLQKVMEKLMHSK